MGKIGKLPPEAASLAHEIVDLKARCMRAGLIKTAHALEPATQAIGWEMAEILQGERPDCLVEHPQTPVYHDGEVVIEETP